MQYWQTPQFKKLEEEWEQKLRDSGFVDAEKLTATGGRTLRRLSMSITRRSELEFHEAKAEYFRQLGMCLQDPDKRKSHSPLDIGIMRLRFIGYRPVEIISILSTVGISIDKHTVSSITHAMEKTWKLHTR